jgi:carbon-monoxide dehydrogenase large subunit
VSSEARGLIGHSVARVEDAALLRGRARFLDDLHPAGLLHVALVRSPLAHARIDGWDLDLARQAPGVVAVFSGSDLEGLAEAFRVHVTTPGAIAPDRWLIARDRVRFVGEVLAAVVADSRYRAEDAADLVSIDMKQLPMVSTIDDAMAEGAALVHDNVPDNIYFHGHQVLGDLDRAFAEADVVIESETVHPRVAPSPIECRGAIAAPDGKGVVEWSSTQAPYLVADAIAECCGLDVTAVRVIAPDIGGGFGGKAHVYPEEVLLAWIAMRLSAPVKWVEDRWENLQAGNHARDQKVHVSAAVRGDGRVLGLRATIYSNVGAYGIRPHGPLLDPMTTASLITGPYDIRAYEYDTYAVASNRVPAGPYRGVGMVTAVLVHERLMDLIGVRLNIDPAEVRRRNFVPADKMPYLSVTGHPYESGDYSETLEAALLMFDYTAARIEQQKGREQGRLLGIGLGSYVEFTAAGSATFANRGMIGISGIDTAYVWLDQDGSFRAQSSCPAIGQGSQTTIGQVVAEGLGVDLRMVTVEQTDTSLVPLGTGSYQSRSSVSGATSAYRAAKRLREQILKAASYRLDEPAERLGLAGSAITIDGSASALTLADLAGAEPEVNGGYRLSVLLSYDPPQAAHPYATHVCLVEVDPGTGAVEILRYVVAEDCGNVINPMIVDGQVQGGVAQGIGAALFEEIRYGADGQLISGSFMDYLLPTAAEIPELEIKHIVTPATMHELGTKGVGEGGTIGSTAAVTNAVADALRMSGASLSLPLNPAFVLSLIKARSPTVAPVG